MEKAQQVKALFAPAEPGFGSQQSKNKTKNQLSTVYNPVPWQMEHSFGLMGTKNTSSARTHVQANIYVFFVNILGLGRWLSRTCHTIIRI